MEVEEPGDIIEIAKEAAIEMTDDGDGGQCVVRESEAVVLPEEEEEHVKDTSCPTTPVDEEELKKTQLCSVGLAAVDELCVKSVVAKPCESLPAPSPAKNSSPTEERQNSIYHIKWISYHNQKTPIITQNENGPCPLIAIMNILILKGRVKLPLTVDIVTSENLMQHLSESIIDSVPKSITEGTRLNYEQNVCDAMNVMPKLQTGLDVNVKFTGIQDFEYTPECVIFDLLGIPLYHGWLVDPQIPDVVHAVGKCSYNQLVEKIINFRSSQNEDNVAEAMVAEAFLDQTASQLTYHGLCKLTSSLRDAELCVLFRNNHFISLIKHDDLLYQLVTDQGFLNENVVWESLNNIEGDSQFFDSEFLLVPPKVLTGGAIIPNLIVPAEQQIDQDYLVALTLQEEQHVQHDTDQEWEEYKMMNLGAAQTLPDEELARRLQEVENRAEVLQRSQQTSPSSSQISNPVPNAANRNRSREQKEADDCKNVEDGDQCWQLVKKSKKKKKKKKSNKRNKFL